MRAAERFVPLAVWLRGPIPELQPEPEPGPRVPSPPPEPAPVEAESPSPERTDLLQAQAEALRDVRLFRARLADALDAATVQLMRELAYAVLGRELQAAPADVATLAARLIAEHPAAEPVVLRHAPGETLRSPIPMVADAALEPGDLVVVFEHGAVDARLGVRLSVALEAWS